MLNITVKFRKGLNDGSHQYYHVDEADLQEQVRIHVPEVDYRDFIYTSDGYITDGDKKVQHIIGVKKQWGWDLIPVAVSYSLA